MKTWNRTLKGRTGHLIALIGVFAAAVAIVMGLWNVIIPSLTGWTPITYLQAAGLMILGRMLTGSAFHPFGFFMHSDFRQRQEHIRFRERLHRLSREERKEFIRHRMAGKEGEPEEKENGPKEA